jgi:hypothetical protein
MSGIIGGAGSKSGVIGTTELDYEEGIHTVVATASDGTIVLNSSGGYDSGGYNKMGYVKIGNLVILSGQVVVASVSGGPTNTLFSLPFVSASTAKHSNPIPFRTSNSFIADGINITGTNVCGYISIPSQTTMRMQSLVDNASPSDIAPLDNDTYYISITYHTDS